MMKNHKKIQKLLFVRFLNRFDNIAIIMGIIDKSTWFLNIFLNIMSHSMLVFFIINAIELSDVSKHFGSIIIKGNKTVFSYGNEKKSRSQTFFLESNSINFCIIIFCVGEIAQWDTQTSLIHHERSKRNTSIPFAI